MDAQHVDARPNTWFGTITRPASHLVATTAVFVCIIVATVVSASLPQWAPLVVGLAAVPALLWYFTMMNAHRQNRRHPDAGPVADTTGERLSWLYIVSNPRGHLVATTLVWSFFLGAVPATGLLPEVKMWIAVPAAVAVVAWYVVMMRAYTNARRAQRHPVQT